MRMPNPDAPLCDCNVLERAANDPENPIVFAANLNEYHIRTGEGGHMMIYHCPFCGGRTPKSKRDTLFAHLTHAETLRLATLTSKFTTLSEVLSAFGTPDEDFLTGEGVGSPEEEGKPETMTYYRALTFKNLSDTANVRVIVYPDDRVGFAFMGKFIGKTAEQGPP